MFKTWEKIVAEHKELEEKMKEYNEIQNHRLAEHNSKRAPRMRKETALRNQLLTCTERERKELEAKIDTIVDELKLINKELHVLAIKECRLMEEIREYIKENLTEREQKKAKKSGWID